MSDMKVQVLIDLLYDSGKAQQAAKDLALIAEATEAADKASQSLTKDFDLAQQAGAAFTTRLDTAADSAVTAADAVMKAQDALSSIGSGFGAAEGGANAAATAFERTGEALAGLGGGTDPFARLDGSMARAEGQAQQLADAIRAIDAGEGVPAGVTATTAALERQLTLEEELRSLLSEPVPPGPMAAYFEQIRAEEAAAREALAAPATDGALAAVEATVAALKEEASLAAEAHEAVGRPAAGGGSPLGTGPLPSPADEVDERERPPREPRAPDEPVPVPAGGGHGGPGIVGTVLGFEEIEKSWDLFKDSIEHAAETASIDAHLHAANVPQPEIDEMHRAAADISRESRIFSSNQILEGLKDGRTVLGSTEHSIAAMRDLTKLMMLEESVNPGHGVEAAFGIVKAGEIANKTNNPEQFHDFVDDIAKPTEVFGKTIKPAEYKNFYSRAGASGMNLPRFFTRDVLPHLLQEMPGETVGTMMNSSNRALVGGQTTKTAVDSFDKLGLADWSHIHIEKGKYITEAGWLKGSDDPNWNLYDWTRKFYKPALEGEFNPEIKAHPLSKGDIEHHYTADFSNRNVSKAVRIMADQDGIIQKDAAQIEAAPGLAGVDRLAHEDPHLASMAVGSQFANFGQIAGGPFMTPMIEGKNALADILARVNQTLEPVPEVAAGILGSVTTGAAYVGAKTLQLLPSKVMQTIGSGAEGLIGGAARFAGPVGAVITGAELARFAEHEMERVTSPDAMKYAFDQIPGWREHGEIARRSADDFKRDPEAARGRAMADLDRTSRGGMPLDVPDYLRHSAGDPIHVVIDGDKSGKAPGLDGPHVDWKAPYGSAAHPAGLAIPLPTGMQSPTGGTVMPTLAQAAGPVTNNNQQTTNVTNTYHVSAPVTVNVAAPAAAPAAVGGAVAAAVTSAVKQSPAVMHDGYGPN